MKKEKWFAISVSLALLVPLLFAPVSGRAQPTSMTSLLTASPPLISPIIDIWSGDGGDNVGSRVTYNESHNEYLALWWNVWGGNQDIYARRVGADGSVLDWFSVITGSGQNYTWPVAAFSPVHERYLIVYTHEVSTTNSDIWGILVSWDGAWMGTPFPIRQEVDHQHKPAVAYNNQDDEFLVVYENQWAGGLYDIAAQRVRASDGALLSWRSIATGSPDQRMRPRVAYNAARNEYLITYLYHPGSVYNPSEVYGKVTSADMGTLSNEIHICCADVRCQEVPSVAAGPDEYLVVWADRTCGTNDADIYARRVSGDGIPQATAFPVTTAPDYQSNPAVAFGGKCGYLVTWRHVPNIQTWDVYGRYVMPGQDTAMGDAFVISTEPSFDTWVDAACALSGKCLVIMENLQPGGTEFDIQGRLVMPPYSLYLPAVLRN